MKKLLMLMTALMLVVYLLPLLTVGPGGAAASQDPLYEPGGALLVDASSPSGANPATEASQGEQQDPAHPLLRFDQKTTVTVLVAGVPQTLSLHDYLVGVVAAEMPAGFPEEALKAQALAARTYTLYKISLYEDGMAIPAEHNGAQLCDDPGHCKAYCDVAQKGPELWGGQVDLYLGRVTDAVEQTNGLIAVYEGKPIAAVFHAASGGRTEAAVDVWGSAIPYLQSVTSSGGEESRHYNGSVTVAQADFAAAVKAAYPEAAFPGDPAHWFKSSNRSEAGGVIDVAVGGVRVTGGFIRKIAGLNSTNFKVQVSGTDLIFTTVGYGHGVGMSQYGARALALEGKTFDQIIKHYFTGVELLLKS